MKIKTTRSELREQAKLLEVLEQIESAGMALTDYSAATLQVRMKSVAGKEALERTFFLDPVGRKSRGVKRSLNDCIDDIVARHFDKAMKEAAEFVRSQMKVEFTE